MIPRRALLLVFPLISALCLRTCAAEPAAGALASGWPSDRTALAFLWQNGDRIKYPPVALDAEGKNIYAYAPVARGSAMYGRNYEMVPGQGSFLARGLGEHLAKVVAQANALSLEAYVTPSQKPPVGLGRIITFAAGSDKPNFALARKGRAWLFRLGSSGTPAAGPQDGWLTLCERPEPGPFHLLISCGAGTVTAYVNGQQVHQSNYPGDLSKWRTGELVFGAASDEPNAGAGRLEGVALYTRAVAAAEAEKNASSYRTLVAARKTVTSLRVRAKLLRRSESKTNIDPYFRALALFEYKVEKVLSGSYDKGTIFVNHWTVMQKKLLPLATRPLQAECELLLEPMEAHPELESELAIDSLEWNYDQPVFYDVTEQQ
jgi:hypothetical protein